MRRRLGSIVVALAAFTVTVAHAAPTSTPNGASKTLVKKSQSIGAPNKGALEGGAHLETSAHIRIVGAYVPGDARWGVRELVEAIDRGAREVRKRYPDAVLGVGHISRKDGGEIDRHHSHESGRDADLAFYLVDVGGRPVARDRFLPILPNGIAAADSHVRFDDGRNWALVSALVNDPKARVTHIFVVTHLRTRLLAYAARVGASPALRARVAEVLMQPHHALPHDDHFHVRVGCPPTSKDCIEWPVTSVSVAKAPGKATHKADGVAPAKAKGGPTDGSLAKGKTKPPKLPTKKLVRARSTGHAVEASIELGPLPSGSPPSIAKAPKAAPQEPIAPPAPPTPAPSPSAAPGA